MMDELHLNITIEESSLIDGARKILSVFRPDWDCSLTKFKLFTDGITNKLLGCINPLDESDVVLIRIYGNKTDLLIDRKRETANIRRLNSLGLAPALYGTFDNGLVYEYAHGDVLTTATCRRADVYPLVARRLAELHRSGEPGGDVEADEPALWTTMRKLLSHVPRKFTCEEKEKRFNGFFPKKPDFEAEVSFLKKALSELKSKIVFCHNDLLLGNVVYNEDLRSVTFIDYEYADYSYQAYDIANHFNEFAGVDDVDYSLLPDESFQKNWIRVYLDRYTDTSDGRDDVDRLYLQVERFALASHLLWAIWSCLQAEHSTVDFDFVGYAFVRLGEYFKRKAELYGC